jgi:hypothetical protein
VPTGGHAIPAFPHRRQMKVSQILSAHELANIPLHVELQVSGNVARQ